MYRYIENDELMRERWGIEPSVYFGACIIDEIVQR